MANNQFWVVIFFIIITIPYTSSLFFNLSQIGPHEENNTIKISGNASITNQGIQVTPGQVDSSRVNQTGRATYIEPLHLWDKASRNLTDFTTQFTFVIDSRDSKSAGDGMAFFLAPIGSNIPENAGGSGLGLTNPDLNSTEDPFVAVEFDTYNNDFDPDDGPHVGINIDSMNSVELTPWRNSISVGWECVASITYKASSKTLSVTFTGSVNQSKTTETIHHVVDLRDYLPEWVNFGFSASTGIAFETHNVISWNFNSSLIVGDSHHGTTSPSPYNQGPKTSNSEGNRKKTGLVVWLSLGFSVLLLVILGAGFIMWKRKGRNQIIKENDIFLDLSRDSEFQKVSGAKKFSYPELSGATNNFSEKEILGEGGFGGVYRGLLKEQNMFVAVKRVSKDSKQGQKEYASEVKIISQLRHRNLVQLVGWCHEKGELLLVYEFMPNGSLDSHLFKGKSILNWELRYKIAEGLASGLLYLHEEWEQCVVHRDVKSSNIMLDSDFNAKLGDFGLARLVGHDKGSQTTMIAGTMGYMAPEYVITGKPSKESDVYSFGIVALEIACGRKAIDYKASEEKVNLVQWVWELYGTGKLCDAIDKNLSSNYDVEEMERLMVVGLWCAHPDNKMRPHIRQAIHVLKFEAQLPILPPTMPMLTYFSPAGVFTSIFSDGKFTEGSTQQHSSISTNSSAFSSSSDSSSKSLLHTK